MPMESGYIPTGERMVVVRKSNCQLCGYLCGVEVWLDENEKVVKIKPDPSRYPYDASIMSQCHRFAANKEILDHPERLNTPLKRAGERGSGQWKKVPWDEALDDIVSRLEDLKSRYGAETLATCIGAPHSIYWPMHRFLNLWGTPNNVGIGIVCWNPAVWVNSLTYGWPIENELDLSVTKCVILWGINPAESDCSLFWKTLQDYAHAGGKVVVIDPRRTETAGLAHRWLPIKPGTDGALALGMLHVVIQERLYDREFVNDWCSGFDELCERIKEFSPEKAADITGISPQTLTETARLYAASKPASIFTGLGIDQSGFQCTQALRSIAILRCITGNLDVPGASYLNETPDFIPEADLELSHKLSHEQRRKKLGVDLFRLQRYEGYEKLTQYTKLHNKQLPARYLTSAHPYLVWQAMITGKPYPIRAMVSMASNPLTSQANTKMVYEALKNLDLLISLELFMTPTAMLADYVMPGAGSLERSMIQTYGGVANIAYGGPGAVKPRYQRRTDFDFWCELGKRCGQKRYWPWNTLEEALDDVFAPTGQSWEAFCQTGFYAPERSYQKYKAKGFATPSGKVELFSAILKELGYDPLPSYTDVDKEDDHYTLSLVTGARKHPYYASEFRQVKSFRRRRPHPMAEMSPDTADQLGLKKGDLVWIETPEGRIRHTLAFAEMLPNIVSIEYGWWYPETSAEEPHFGGLWEFNANVLTSADTAQCDPVLGQWNYRSIRCKVYKVEEASQWLS
jgi:anaerobic selenocysteine-containing dehydrogenase